MCYLRQKKKCYFSHDNTEQRKILLIVVGLMKMLPLHHPTVRHWFILIKKHILIGKPIVILLTHRFLSCKYMKHLLMHNIIDNFCFGVKVRYQLQTSKKKHANHGH